MRDSESCAGRMPARASRGHAAGRAERRGKEDVALAGAVLLPDATIGTGALALLAGLVNAHVVPAPLGDCRYDAIRVVVVLLEDEVPPCSHFLTARGDR